MNRVPYYRAYDNYYVWNNGVGGYQSVAPPPQVRNPGAAQRGDTDPFAYPKAGQSAKKLFGHCGCYNNERLAYTAPISAIQRVTCKSI